MSDPRGPAGYGVAHGGRLKRPLQNLYGGVGKCSQVLQKKKKKSKKQKADIS